MRGRRAGRRTAPKHDSIVAYLLAEAAEGRIPIAKDVALAFGVSRPYVHEIRSKLVANGDLPLSPRGRYHDQDPGERLSLDLDRAVRDATKKSLREATRPLVAAMTDAGREFGLDIAAPLAQQAEREHALFDSVLNGSATIMTTDQRRAFLSELALKTHRHEIKVSALAALNRLEASLRSDSRVGPPDPLSASEADARIRELQEARADIFGPTEPSA